MTSSIDSPIQIIEKSVIQIVAAIVFSSLTLKVGVESIARFNINTNLAFSINRTENISLPKSTFCISLYAKYFTKDLSTANIRKFSAFAELSSKEVFLSNETWSNMFLITTVSYLTILTDVEAAIPKNISCQGN